MPDNQISKNWDGTAAEIWPEKSTWFVWKEKVGMVDPTAYFGPTL